MYSKKMISTSHKTISIWPKYLGLLMTSYVMTLVAANWFDPRLINIFGINTGGRLIICSQDQFETYSFSSNHPAIN